VGAGQHVHTRQLLRGAFPVTVSSTGTVKTSVFLVARLAAGHPMRKWPLYLFGNTCIVYFYNHKQHRFTHGHVKDREKNITVSTSIHA
jgi:hypothetical protein